MDNYFDESFDENPHKNHPCLLLLIIMGIPCPEEYIYGGTHQKQRKTFPEPNQSAYSDVQGQISMVEKYLAAHESYKDAVELEDGNYILSDYHIYI